MTSYRKIGQHLLDTGVITDAQLKEALEIQEKKDIFLGTIFLEKGWLTEEQLLKVLADQFKMPFVFLKKATIDPKIKDILPLKLALHYKIMPVKLADSKLTVAVSAPQDIRLLDNLSLALRQKYQLEPVLATEEDIAKAIERFYGLGAETVNQILKDKKATPAGASGTPDQGAVEDIQRQEDASIIKLVNQILIEAHQRRATDIHFEPYRGKMRLRYRVDGVLQNVDIPESMRQLFSPIISRIKVLSGLNLVERRTPQDGRASVVVGDQKLDLRISTLPSSSGEGVVIRILPSGMLFDLADLGFNGRNLEIVEKMILKPYGLIFVTGPTGSGKSTTLYACLKRINTDDKKIITVEDPVEYELPGVLQVPINANVGLSFSQGLRSMLRHDPDVMMVGEVRDLETAELAIRIALTGHLVFSTLHTNDAASGFMRLMDMGIPPYLLGSSVSCFIAQRLLRKICEQCKREVPAEWTETDKVFRGQGCDQCHGTGYNGRRAIYEVLPVTAEIKKLILKSAPAHEIRSVAVKQGMSTLHAEAVEKVRQGLTTPEEVIRITESEEAGV